MNRSPEQHSPLPGMSGTSQNGGASAGAPASSSGGFLSSLTDLESRITMIKSLHEQAVQRESQQAEREKELARREAEVAELAKSMASRGVKAEAELSRARGEMEEAERLRAEAQSVQRAAAEGQQAVAAERERITSEVAARESEIQRRESELHEREFDINAKLEEIERERAGVAEQARTLAAQMKAQDEEASAAIWSNRAEEMQMQLGEVTAARARLETEVSQFHASMESVNQELIVANTARAQAQQEAERRAREMTDLCTRLDDAVAANRTFAEQVESLTEAAKVAAEQHARDVADRDRRLRSSSEEMAENARRIDESNRMLASQESELADKIRAAHEQTQRANVAAASVDRLEKELAAAKELLEQAEAAARESVPVERYRQREVMINDLQAALEEAGKNAAELSRQEAEARDGMIAELKRKLDEAEQVKASVAAGDSQAAALIEQIARRDEEMVSLRARLEESLARAPEPNDAAEHEAAELEISKRDTAITMLKERLDQTVIERDALRTQIENASAIDGGAAGVHPGLSRDPTEADTRRRNRLRTYKGLLRTQAQKIVSAQAALQRRHADCELVLTNRARLAELAHELARAEKRIASGKARSGAAAAILYMVVTIAVLAGLSWEVSKRIWPGTYIARAVVEADVGRRTPKPDELAAWQKDHQDMLSDPRLMEVAADRMQRRGLATIGSAADLGERLKQDLYVQSSKPGSLTIELRGDGAERTALVLDTLVTSFKSVSDQAREQRSNDIGLSIAQAATAGTEPLMDKRLERAGGVFGGAALAAGLAGLVLWSRLVKAKKKFDKAAAVEAAMGEVDWPTLEASIRKHAGTRPG